MVYKLFRGLTTYLYKGVIIIIIKFLIFHHSVALFHQRSLWILLVNRWGENFPHLSRTAKREEIKSLPKFSSTSRPCSRPQELGVVGTRNSDCLVVSNRLNCFCQIGSSSQVRLTIKKYASNHHLVKPEKFPQRRLKICPNRSPNSQSALVFTYKAHLSCQKNWHSPRKKRHPLKDLAKL